MRPRRRELLVRRLADERGRRVVFLSHCLLNENVRYLGGATCPGALPTVVDAVRRQGLGVCQMPCPEQRAWGGVLKRRTLPLYGADAGPLRLVRRPLTAVFLHWTRLAYRRLARQVARDIADYQRSGFDVVGVVGVDGSPSCGVRTTLDMRRTVDALASLDLADLDRHRVNRDAIAANARPGEGLFVTALRAELARRRVEVPLSAHDLVSEVNGEPVPPLRLG